MALDVLIRRETVAFGSAVIKAWWADICSYVPAGFIKFARGTPRTVIIRPSRDRLTISRAEKGAPFEPIEVMSWQNPDSELASRLKDALAWDPQQHPAVRIEPSADMVLVRHLTYPLLAESSLKKLFHGQLDALTPWSDQDAWVGWRVTERRLRARQIDVELHVAPKKQLESLVEAVRSVTAEDFTVVGVAASSDGERGPRMREMSRQDPARSYRAILDVAIFGLPVLLALLIAWIPLQLDRKYLTHLKTETEALRADVDKSIALGKSVSNLEQEFAEVRNQRSEKRSVTEILDLLSSALRDDVWLDHFVVSGQKVELSGSAVDAYAMVASLQGMAEVKDVRLKSPIVKGKQEGQQRFQIELQMEDLK